VGAWLTGAIEDNEMHHFFQLGKAMPFCEPGHVIFTDQTVDRCIAVASPNFFDGIDCVRGCGRRSSQSSTENLDSPLTAARNIANRDSLLAIGAAFFRGEIAAGTKITSSTPNVSRASRARIKWA